MSKTKKTANPKENSKEIIVATAFKLFSTKGYRESSVSQIAKAAGVSKGLMYHYFDSKEALLKGIFDHYRSLTVQPTDWDSNAPAINNLAKLLELSISFLQSQPEIRRFTMLLRLQPPESEQIQEWVRTAKQQWEAAFTEVFTALGYHQPVSEAMYLSAVLDGIALRYLSDPTFPLQEIKALIYRNYGLR